MICEKHKATMDRLANNHANTIKRLKTRVKILKNLKNEDQILMISNCDHEWEIQYNVQVMSGHIPYICPKCMYMNNVIKSDY